MSRNIVKVLDKGFSDIAAGEKMLISSPEKISEFIFEIPKGSFYTIKELLEKSSTGSEPSTKKPPKL